VTVIKTGRSRYWPMNFLEPAVRSGQEQWNRFWFTPTDPAPLGLLRILVGGMLVYSHLVWGMNLPAFLGPDGWNSAELVREFQKNQWNSSFWWVVPEHSMQTVHRCCIAILILFSLGVCTRLTSILALIAHVSYCQRAAISNFGLDQIGGILLLYLVIGPSGAVYSLDSLWSHIRQRQRNPADRHTAEMIAPGFVSAGLALRLIQVHYCVIYFFAATGKLQGSAWWTGEALWRTLANYEYQSADLTWLAWYPEVLQLVTHVTVLWELSFAYLIWVRPLRPLMLATGVAMHLGIGAFLGMWTFGLMVIFGYVAFLKPETVRAVVNRPFARFRTGI
jgi:hypothetical protein